MVKRHSKRAALVQTALRHSHLRLGMIQQLLVSEVWVYLHLNGCRLNASIAQQVICLPAAEVGDANSFHQAVINKLLHCLPSVLSGNASQMGLAKR